MNDHEYIKFQTYHLFNLIDLLRNLIINIHLCLP